MCRRRGGSSTLSLSRRSPALSPRSTLHGTRASASRGAAPRCAAESHISAGVVPQCTLQQAVPEPSSGQRGPGPCCAAVHVQHPRNACAAALQRCAHRSRYSWRSSLPSREAMPAYMVLPPLQGNARRGKAQGQQVTSSCSVAAAPHVLLPGGAGFRGCMATQLAGVPPTGDRQHHNQHLRTMLEYSLSRLSMSLSCSSRGRANKPASASMVGGLPPPGALPLAGNHHLRRSCFRCRPTRLYAVVHHFCNARRLHSQ